MKYKKFRSTAIIVIERMKGMDNQTIIDRTHKPPRESTIFGSEVSDLSCEPIVLNVYYLVKILLITEVDK